MKSVYLSFFFSFFLGLSSFSQVAKFSNEFLAIGVGARAQGMGNVQVGFVDDVTAGYWNTSGLTRMTGDFQVSAMHAEWFAGIGQYDYLSIARPIKSEGVRRVFGVSLIRFAIDDIPNTLDLIDGDGTINFDNLSSFTAGDYAGLFSYAQETSIPGLSVGGNIKIIHRRAGKFAQAWGFGLDLSASYQIKDSWFFGVSAKDITSTFNAWRFDFTQNEQAILDLTGNTIPSSSIEITTPRIILGTAYNMQLAKKFHILAAADFTFTTDGRRNVLVNSSFLNIDPAIGIEANYNDLVFFRAGLHNFQKAVSDPTTTNSVFTMQPNIGAGVKINGIRLDYALTDVGDVSQVLYSHIFSLVLELKISKKRTSTIRPGIPERIIEQID